MILFRSGSKPLFRTKRQEYKENDDESARFERVAEQINEFIENDVEPSANGIAIFASLGDTAYFETMQLDVAFPENKMYAYDRPHIFPLVRALHSNPKYAVLWADTNKADIYVFGGENRIRSDNNAADKVEAIENTVTNRTQVGGWSQSRYQRHVENFHLQHAKEVVDELDDLMRKKEIEYLVLCGDETTIMPILKPQLPKPLAEKVVGTINMSQYESVDEIQAKTREVIGIESSVRDKAAIERVQDAANAAAGLGTLGLEDTLRALANGQVQELVISSDLDAVDYDPNEVRTIIEEYRPNDEHAPVSVPPIADIAGEIADQLILRAINTDAQITVIDDASLLKDAGGVGSILRYNMNAKASG